MPENRVPIKYTSRDFQSIRRDLIDYAKRYYAETFRDFSEASFGSLMIDTVAYVGDILSFYLDYQVNESFVDTSIEYNNVLNHGAQMGYRFRGPTSAYGVCAFFVEVPANTTGEGPDSAYFPILKKGTTVSSTGGATFILLEDLDFGHPSNRWVTFSQNSTTNAPLSFGVQAFGRVVSGELGTELLPVGAFQRFRKLELQTLDVVEVLSVADNEGNVYYEVPFLSQDVIYQGITNRGQTSNTQPAVILRPFSVPRRFVMERSARRTSLQFGYGSQTENNAPAVADPTNVVIQKIGRDYVSDTSFDPSRLLDSDKFGISPSNTTLRVNFRRNTVSNSAAAAETITQVVESELVFQNPGTLNGAKRNSVIGSLSVTNFDPITGQSANPSLAELKQEILGNFAAQDRTVTEQDYKAFIYTMPGQYGSVKRCAVYRDPDSFRRNLNLYVISTDKNGYLTPTNATVKENLKSWMGQSKMINDTIDMLDAKVVNIAVHYTLLSYGVVNSLDLVVQANELLKRTYSSKLEIGQSFDLDAVRQSLSGLPGVSGVRNVRIVNKFGGDYSSISYNVEDYVDAQNRFVEVPKNVILEIKYPDRDLHGSINN